MELGNTVNSEGRSVYWMGEMRKGGNGAERQNIIPEDSDLLPFLKNHPARCSRCLRVVHRF